MSESISFELNGKPVRLQVDGGRSLLWVLRTELGLTGAKYGCGEGHCGCCTVLVDGTAQRSCVLDTRAVGGKRVVTIEGLAKGDTLHPVQRAFVEHDALQCGFCTPGQVLHAVSFLRKNPHPTREQIMRGMNANLCRCGAYTRIIDAVQSAAKAMAGGSDS